MRLNLSLTPEDVDNALFTCKAKAKHGQIILRVSRDRFVDIVSAFLEFKEQQKLIELSKLAH